MSQQPREGEQSVGGVGAADSVCSWQQHRRVLGWCMTLDLPDLNPRPASGLDPQLWEKEWDEMINSLNSFGLVTHGNISICMTVNYKQEYQRTHEKYRLCMTKSIYLKEKHRGGSDQHSAEPGHLLSSVSLLGVAYIKL